MILDADLADVKDYLGGRPHPGKDRTSGHFGFAGHSDPVEYRNVRIRQLNDELASVKNAKVGSTPNVHQVGDLLLAGQPSSDDISLMKDMGIGHVLDLRSAGEVDWDEAHKVQANGIGYTRLAIADPKDMDEKLFETARKIFRGASEKHKVFCHCGGANRVGAVWLAYRVLDEDVDWATALKEAHEVGLVSPALEKATKKYLDAQKK